MCVKYICLISVRVCVQHSIQCCWLRNGCSCSCSWSILSDSNVCVIIFRASREKQYCKIIKWQQMYYTIFDCKYRTRKTIKPNGHHISTRPFTISRPRITRKCEWSCFFLLVLHAIRYYAMDLRGCFWRER